MLEASGGISPSISAILIQMISPLQSTGKHHLLSFDNFRVFSYMCLMYKILNGLALPPLEALVDLRTEGYIKSTQISSTRHCKTPYCRSAFGQSTFCVKATSQWNALPDTIKNCTSIHSSKMNLKALLKDSQQHCSHGF